MNVNFNLCNHTPVQIQDFVDYVAAAVEDLGLPFMLSGSLRPGAINVMLENFAHPEVLEEVERTCRRHPDMPFVIIGSEVMQDNIFNSGGWHAGVVDRSPYSRMDEWSQRTVGFRRVAPLAHAILCPSELVYASYTEHGIGERLHYLPLVHFDRFASPASGPAAAVEVEQDIDFLFTGVLTTRRALALGVLERHGFSVVNLPGTSPEYIRHHFMRRAKVYVALKHFTDTKTLSKMRAYWALCHGYFCMVEAGTDPTDLDEHLRWFSSVEQLIEAASLDRATRQAMAAGQLERFRTAVTPNPLAAALAPWLDGFGDAARPAATLGQAGPLV